MITKLKTQKPNMSIRDLEVELYVTQKNSRPERPVPDILLSPWRLGLVRNQNPFYARNNVGWTGRDS